MLLPTTKCAITSQKAIDKEVAKAVMQTSSKLMLLRACGELG
jgi:hypothetical protein